MSTRERWIVYPLLFLALGIAMRNQFLPTKRFGAMDLKAADLTAQTIHCNTIEVMQDGIVRNNLGVVQELQFQRGRGGTLHTDYIESQQSKTGEAAFRRVAVSDEKGKDVVVIQENPNTKSGTILTMTADGAPQMLLGSNNIGGVMMAFGHLGRALLEFGHEEKISGVFGLYPQGPVSLLTNPWPQQMIPKIGPTPLPKTTPEKKEEEPKKENEHKP
jgi:hypothetical protein